MRARRATECWLAGRRKACVEGTHRHMHARGVQLSLRLQAVEKRSLIRRKSKRCTCAPTQAILSAKEAAMGLCAKKGGWFEGSRTASISPRPPSPAVPHASSFESTSGAGDFGHPATSTRSSWGDFAQRGERARDWGGVGRQRECWAARLHVAMREEKRGKGALTVNPLRWYTSLPVDRKPRKAALRRC